MMHKPLQIKNLSLSFSHKTCFDDFNAEITYGDRIGIIGRNGSGKTTLLRILCGEEQPTSGLIQCVHAIFGFVPQIFSSLDSQQSGSEQLNVAITEALCLEPNILLLDEPTNHLDKSNRKSLMRMLQTYSGTLFIVSHDVALLRHSVDILWHIDDGCIKVFKGAYDDYMQERYKSRVELEREIANLNRQKKEMHYALMKEQKRAAKSKSKGEKNIHRKKWPTIVSAAKAGRAQETSGRHKSSIERKKHVFSEKLLNIHLSEVIVPKFSLSSAPLDRRTIVSISDGKIGYLENHPILQKINLSIGSGDRITIEGDNASGKSTLIKAIMNSQGIIKQGDWCTPKIDDIGYLDQHYNTLVAERTVLETITHVQPAWSLVKARRHLNDFLFRKNEEVNNYVFQLSGGEKARLSLAQIAAQTPKLLILDEVTNNLDLETKEHIMQILKEYPGAMIVISHDDEFLCKIGINYQYYIKDGVLST